MRLRLLLTFALILSMATIATSNESSRYCRHAAGCKASGEANNEAADFQKPAPKPSSASAESSTLLVNKLLLI
jgi:hypothetical protein